MTRVLRAFWHRTRKVFVPLTLEEVSRRAKVTLAEAECALRSLAHDGLAQSKRLDGKQGTSTWNLTDYGRHTARQMIEQQERING